MTSKWYKLDDSSLDPDSIFLYPIYTDEIPNTVGYSFSLVDVSSSSSSSSSSSHSLTHVEEIGSDIGKIYDLIANIAKFYIDNQTTCRVKSETIVRLSPESILLKSQKESGEKYQFSTCCGYTAPVFAFYVSMFLMGMNHPSNSPDSYSKYINILKGNHEGHMFIIDPQTQGSIHELSKMRFNKKELIHAGTQFYEMVSPYCFYDDPSTYSREYMSSGQMTCEPGHTELREGPNLVTLYSGDKGPTTCITHHHFFAYVEGKYVIVADTWAGGNYGKRGYWRRIMNLPDFQNVLNNLSSVDVDDKTRTNLLKVYFYAPDDYFVLDNTTTSKSYRKIELSVTTPLKVCSFNNVDSFVDDEILFSKVLKYGFIEDPRITPSVTRAATTRTKRSLEENTADTKNPTSPLPLPPPPKRIRKKPEAVPAGGGKRTRSKKTRKYRRNRITQKKKRTLGKKKKRKTRK